MSSGENVAPAPAPNSGSDGISATPPTNHLVRPLMTDLYQITMAYAYWKNQRHNDHSIFELFFRKNPFDGEYTIFAGLDEVLKFVSSYKFSHTDLQYLKSVPSLQNCEAAFFDEYLAKLSTSDVKIYALQEGTVCFPKIPLLIVEGPLGICQLLETTLLTLINFPSLIATNASRMVLASLRKQMSPPAPTKRRSGGSTAHPEQCYKPPNCVEFGLRRAQGPDGGFSASKYSYIGGFHGTSNVLAGKKLGIPIVGTHAHAFVMSFINLEEVQNLKLKRKRKKKKKSTDEDDAPVEDEEISLLPLVLQYRKELTMQEQADEGNKNKLDFEATNDGELAAFIAYAVSFPHSFLCLIDTYDTLRSGVLNFILVAMVLFDLGYAPLGIRLDSGNLAKLSYQCCTLFQKFASTSASGSNGKKPRNRDFFNSLSVVVSNDINEETLEEINSEVHGITSYGIGTNLVTCQKQPALGCVYKLVSINENPRMKLSQSITKVVIPGNKRAYRLYGSSSEHPLCDIMMLEDNDDDDGGSGQKILCRHPFEEGKRFYVKPTKIQALHDVVYANGTIFKTNIIHTTIHDIKRYVCHQLNIPIPANLDGNEQHEKEYGSFASDILQYRSPKKYDVMVSSSLYNYLHDLWQKEMPIPEIS